MNITTHLCLVSGQPTPNLTPVTDRSMAPKRVILLVSPTMQQQADRLGSVMSSRGIKVEQWHIDDPYDIEAIQDSVLSLLDREKALLETHAIALNATGGTKPMSIAAYEVFRDFGLPIFYVHPDYDRVVWLFPNDQPARNLEDRLKLEPFLQAHGVTVSGKPARSIPDEALTACARDIVDSYDRYESVFGAINHLAAGTDRQTLLSERIASDQGNLAALIDTFEKHGFLTRVDGRLRFPDEEARFYVNGGWLEAWVFDAVRRARRKDPAIQDVAWGVEVMREERGRAIHNELDVVFLRNNRLHLIECKTSKFTGAGEDSPGAEAIYKLDSLKDLMGGLQARAMLVSYRKIAPAIRARAEDLGIVVCAGQQLAHLQTYLKKLIS